MGIKGKYQRFGVLQFQVRIDSIEVKANVHRKTGKTT